MKLFTSDWDFNPRDWDLNPAKTHGTWFQDLMKFRFLVSAQKEFGERPSDREEEDLLRIREKHAPQTECRPSQRASVALKRGLGSFYGLGNFMG